VRGRDRAAAQGRQRPGGAAGVHRRAPHAELPGHRDARGAAAAGRRQRPEHRGERLGERQRHPAAAECAVGPGARNRAAHQGGRLADVRPLEATLAMPVGQVLIEGRIVIGNNDFERSLSARFGLSNYQKYGSTGLVTTSGTAAGTDQALGSALTNLAGSPPGNPTIYPISVPSGSAASNRYNVTLPVTSAAGTIALGILGNYFIVDLELSAAQAETQANIISSPRVITANQKEAIIEQGVEIPYQQSAKGPTPGSS